MHCTCTCTCTLQHNIHVQFRIITLRIDSTYLHNFTYTVHVHVHVYVVAQLCFFFVHVTGSALFSTSPGLLASHAHQLQMMQQQSVLLQQLRQQQQQQQQHHIIQGGSLPSAQSPASLGGNIVTSRTNTPPMQNSIPPSGGLVMAASGHGFQHSFHVAGSESPLRSSSSGGNRIRAPISHIPSGNAPFQDVRGRPHLAAIGRNELPQSTSKSLLQSKQSLNPGAGAPRSHLPSQQVT